MMIHPSMIPVYNWYWYASEYSEMTEGEREFNLMMMGSQTLAINLISIRMTGLPSSPLRTYMNMLNYVFHTPGRPPLATTVKPMAGSLLGTALVAAGVKVTTYPGADYTRGPYGTVTVVPRLGLYPTSS